MLTFNTSTPEAEAKISEFEASRVYRVHSRTARETKKNLVSKQKNLRVGLCQISPYIFMY